MGEKAEIMGKTLREVKGRALQKPCTLKWHGRKLTDKTTLLIVNSGMLSCTVFRFL